MVHREGPGPQGGGDAADATTHGPRVRRGRRPAHCARTARRWPPGAPWDSEDERSAVECQRAEGGSPEALGLPTPMPRPSCADRRGHLSALRDSKGGVFAQCTHSTNYYVVHPGNTPANHPPTEACMIHSKQHRGVRSSGSWDPWLKTADFSHSAWCAPKGHPPPPKNITFAPGSPPHPHPHPHDCGSACGLHPSPPPPPPQTQIPLGGGRQK